MYWLTSCSTEYRFESSLGEDDLGRVLPRPESQRPVLKPAPSTHDRFCVEQERTSIDGHNKAAASELGR